MEEAVPFSIVLESSSGPEAVLSLIPVSALKISEGVQVMEDKVLLSGLGREVISRQDFGEKQLEK